MDTKNIIEHLKNHRSIRKYKDQAIDPSILKEILEAGIRASSSGNMQSYSIIVTTDKELKEKLRPLHFDQEMVTEAPAMVTFCADFNRMKKWLTLSDAPQNFDNPMSFMIGAIDAILVSQNVALAAQAYGLGICYMGTTLANCEKIGKALNLPKNVVPVVGYSLGYPDETPELRDRLSLETLVHYDTYHDPSDEEVLKSYQEREQKGMERYQSYPRLKEMMEEVGAKNLAQVYTKAKYTRESHIDYSNTIINYLKEQNFMELL